MTDSYLSLGSNMGDRAEYIRKAMAKIHEADGIELVKISSFYETASWVNETQPPFINAAVKIKTTLSPTELLRTANAIETELGRVRHEHWGNRTIDIDILHYEGVTMDTEELCLPHRYLTKRKFVLVPLDEIAGLAMIAGKKVKQHLMGCLDTGLVRKVTGSPRDFYMTALACAGENWGISLKGEDLFVFPEDRDLFREKTIGHTVILGRHTLETFPRRRPLKGRENIVLTHSEDNIPGAKVCSSMEKMWKALEYSRSRKFFVIGGGEIYRLLLPYVNYADITFVKKIAEADVFMPDPAAHDFVLKSCVPGLSETGLEYEIRRYVKST